MYVCNICLDVSLAGGSYKHDMKTVVVGLDFEGFEGGKDTKDSER
jgi:hypothetical protein